MKRSLLTKSLLGVLGICISVMLAGPSPARGIAPADAAAPFRRVGYFVQWGMYSRNYRVKNIVTTGSADKLTHINYAFANVGTDSRCYEETRLGWGDASADYEVKYSADQSVDGQADELGQPLKGHFNQLKKLKAMYPNLKVLMSIGGFTWSGRFSDAALLELRRPAGDRR